MQPWHGLIHDLEEARRRAKHGVLVNPRTIPVPCNIGDSGDPLFVNRELPNPYYDPSLPEGYTNVGFSDPPRKIEPDESPVFNYTPPESSIYRPPSNEFSSHGVNDCSYGKPDYSPWSSDPTRDQFGAKRDAWGNYVSEAPSLWRP